MKSEQDIVEALRHDARAQRLSSVIVPTVGTPRNLWERILLNLDARAVLEFARTAPFFNSIVTQFATVQNQLRAFASTLPRFIPLQRAYLDSPRLEQNIRRRGLTLNQAIASVAAERLPAATISNFHCRRSAIELGVSPAEVQFAVWLQDIHINALRANIPFEEIMGLNYHAVEAMLVTQNSDYALTRQDVYGVELTNGHIEALRKGMSFEKVKTFSELQLNALSAGFSEEDIQQSWLSREHLEAVQSHGFPIEATRGLSSHQLQAIQLGVPYADVVGVKITQDHINALQKGLSFQDIQDLSERQLNAYIYSGHCLNVIAGLNAAQLDALQYSGVGTVEQVTQAGFLELTQKHPWASGVQILQRLQRGYSVKQLESLTRMQLRGLLWGGGCGCDFRTSNASQVFWRSHGCNESRIRF